jgi:hypothetical protein
MCNEEGEVRKALGEAPSHIVIFFIQEDVSIGFVLEYAILILVPGNIGLDTKVSLSL